MSKVTKTEKILREGINKWKNFLNEGAFKQSEKNTPMHMGKPIQVDDEGNRYIIDDKGRTVWLSVSDDYVEENQVSEARMGEYGKIDAEDGNPPSKIGRGNEEYMAAYNAVLQARGEQPLDIQQPDAAYLDALRSGNLEERSADDERDLEEPVKYGTGHELEWDPKEEKLYDRKRDIYLSDEEEDAVVAARQAEVDRKNKEFDMRRQNKEFGSAPYHFEEGAGHDESLAQAQNQGVAFIRGKDDKAAGKEKDPSFSEESGRNPLEVLFYNAGYNSELSENFSAKTEGKNPEMNLQSLAKGKAMSLLQTAKAMAQAPSHEPARGYAAAVSKDAGEIVDLMVELESFQAGTYVGASPTRESNEGAGKSYSTGEEPQEYDTVSLDGAEYEVKMIMPNGDVDISRDGRYGSESLTISPDNLEFISREGEEATVGESNEPFDMDAHMAAYENEPETIEYRKQIKQLVQMVADKKGIPVEQAAEEIASYVVTAGGLKEAIGAMNTSQTTRYGVKGSGYGDGKKPSPAPAGKKLSGTQKALAFIKDRFGKDAKELGIDTFELTMHIGRPKTDEELKTKVIDFIQKNNIKIKEGNERTALKLAIQRRIETGRELAKELYANGQDESAQEVLNDVEAEEKRFAYLDSPASELDAPVQEGAGDKEARIRDVVKMGSWDNIDGVPLSLPQAELLVAAMDNLSPANKTKLMAMPINKMLDIVNKMVDAGVITVNYGRAGLKEYGDHDAQASGGLVHSTYSSDPELDQIADIAADKKDWGLLSIEKALKEQGFDTSLTNGVLVIDGKYFIGKEDKFDISPDEEIRRIEGTSLVAGYMG